MTPDKCVKLAELQRRVKEWRAINIGGGGLSAFHSIRMRADLLAAIDALKAENAQQEKQILLNFEQAEEAMAEAQKLRALVGRLGEGLDEIDAWLCDKELYGHFVPEEIRSATRRLRAEASAVGRKGERDG